MAELGRDVVLGEVPVGVTQVPGGPLDIGHPVELRADGARGATATELVLALVVRCRRSAGRATSVRGRPGIGVVVVTAAGPAARGWTGS